MMNHSRRTFSMFRNAVCAALAVGWTSSAATAAPPKPQPAAKPAAHKSITYTGRVLDRVSGKPIAGAAVTIEHTVSSSGRLQPKTFKRVTRATTDAKGEYSFTLPPDEVARPNLYITVSAEHSNYAGKGRSGYSHAMIVKNRRLGESPFFSEIKLWPGKAVTAVVVAPDGSAIAGAKVTTFSKHERARRLEFGSFGETKTDKKGRLRFVVPTPGAAVFCIYPERYAVQALYVGRQRGDLGKIVVQKGTRLKGRVLDARGKPLAGIDVGARKSRDNSEADTFLQQNAVANFIVRNTHTGANGEFVLDDLPDGKYNFRVEPNRNLTVKVSRHVFLRRAVALSAAAKPAPLEIRAIPHVELHATWVDSKGKPTRGYEFFVLGRLDGHSWFGRSGQPDKKTGKIVAVLPHGLQNVSLSLSTNEHSSLGWRLKPGDALHRGSRVRLGNVDDDVSGMQIVHFTAPILLLKPVDENGKPVRDVTIQSDYEPDKPPAKFAIRFRTGHVRFQQQKDSRWRSSQMQPDIAVKVTVRKDGYEAKPQTVSLKEGKERELVFVLKKK